MERASPRRSGNEQIAADVEFGSAQAIAQDYVRYLGAERSPIRPRRGDARA